MGDTSLLSQASTAWQGTIRHPTSQRSDQPTVLAPSDTLVDVMSNFRRRQIKLIMCVFRKICLRGINRPLAAFRSKVPNRTLRSHRNKNNLDCVAFYSNNLIHARIGMNIISIFRQRRKTYPSKRSLNQVWHILSSNHICLFFSHR